MKKLVFIALISLFYSSCKKAIQKEEILEIKENSFTCKIEAANLKVNVNNNEQCANYFNYTQDSENGFKLEAGQLKDVVGILLNINLINFQVNSNKTKGKFFYVDYKGELNDEHKTMVVNRLLEHYNLKIDTVQKKVAINSLKITNKDKLGSFLSKVDRQKQLRTSLKISGNEAVFENFTLSGFAKELQKFYLQRFEFEEKEGAGNYYSFEMIFSKNLNEILNFLEEELGVSMEKVYRDVNMVYVLDK